MRHDRAEFNPFMSGWDRFWRVVFLLIVMALALASLESQAVVVVPARPVIVPRPAIAPRPAPVRPAPEHVTPRPAPVIVPAMPPRKQCDEKKEKCK